MRVLGRHLVLPTVLLTLAAGCTPAGLSTSNDDTATPAPGTSRPGEPQPVEVVEITPRPSATSPSASSSPSTSESPHPAAGGPAPPEAIAATALDGDVALVVTPSGNITCALSAHTAGCTITSYAEDMPYGADTFGPRWWVALDEHPVAVVSTPEAPFTEITEVVPQEITYGQVVQYGDHVCASESNGLTCWNTSTGHGAFMNRRATQVF
ncbi:MAG: hypothetical protein Q4D89_04495 [Arachnia propionica]|uniref:hypothetical protein n=1 Tax=Arachnia propionica TaxID=1750 RepID=UPI0026FB64FA|nr:hypothetical protein [Arachnia propionica]